MGHPSNAPVNFDSPTAAAALGALGINDLGLDNISMGGLVTGSGRGGEEEFRKKLDDVIDLLWVSGAAVRGYPKIMLTISKRAPRALS